MDARRKINRVQRTPYGWEITPHRWYWPDPIPWWRRIIVCLKMGWRM